MEGSTLLHETTGTRADCLGMLGRILTYRKNLFACIHHYNLSRASGINCKSLALLAFYASNSFWSPALDVRGDTENETQNYKYDRNLQRCSLLCKSLTSHAH